MYILFVIISYIGCVFSKNKDAKIYFAIVGCLGVIGLVQSYKTLCTSICGLSVGH